VRSAVAPENSHVNIAYISAFLLSGSAIGGVVSIATTWLTHFVGSVPASCPNRWFGERIVRRFHSSEKGFLRDLPGDAEPHMARSMSMKARRPAGTCRCPG
jgi:hypothetical protein